MPTPLAVLYLFGGVIWLLMGGDLLIRGSISLSQKAGVPPLVVGLTVVAFGTSAPELVVSLRAALTGYPDLSIANVVGSNIANVLLVVGLPAIVYPMTCNQPGARKDAAVMVGVSVLFFALCTLGELGRPAGLALLAAFGLFLLYALQASMAEQSWEDESEEWERGLGLPRTSTMIATFLVLGTLALPLGADLLVRGAVSLADALGVASSVVGLTFVALGTSLPELATTLVAAFKREAALAVGNVIGSNMVNLLAIMGITAAVSPAPIPIPAGFLSLNLPLMVAAAATLAWAIHRRGVVGRRMGALLLASYLVFVVVLL